MFVTCLRVWWSLSKHERSPRSGRFGQKEEVCRRRKRWSEQNLDTQDHVASAFYPAASAGCLR